MNDKKIIMAGLANSKTSLGEVFRRYVSCFQNFCKPDVFDLTSFTNNDELYYHYYNQYHGPIDHDVKYFHSTMSLYRDIKRNTKQYPRKENVKKIGYFVWESSELHDQDVEVLKDFDQIWTASNYCKDVFSQYIDSDNIKVVPHPIPATKKEYKKYKNFTILVIGSLLSGDDRKNISTNLKTACALQQKNKNIDIIFKTWSCSDHERTVINQFAKLGKIKIIDEYYDTEKTIELMAKCHMVVSLHTSEGYGLTLAEAATVNTVPICTGYGGNTDFIFDKDLLVDYTETDVTNPYYKGKWAHPILDDAIDKMQNVIDHYEKYLEKTKIIKQHLKQNNSNFTVSENIKQLLYTETNWNNTYNELILHPNSLKEDYAGGIFNPAYLNVNDQNILLCRAETINDLFRKTPYEGKTENLIIYMSDDNKTITDYKLTKSVNSLEKYEKVEDFRSIKIKNKQYVASTILNRNDIKCGLLQLDEKTLKIKKYIIPTLKDFQTKQVEKNWSYFEKNDDLYLLYSCEPYIIFKHTKNFVFEKHLQINGNLAFSTNKNTVSNSINPFVLDDHLYHIVHVNIGNKTYKHHAVLINKETLIPEYYSQQPLFEKDNCYGSHQKLLYLTDYKINHDDVEFFFGEGDLCVTKKTMSFEELKNLNWIKYE